MEDATGGSSSSGAVAVMAQPMGAMLRRNSTNTADAKYKNAPDYAGATKQRKKRAR
jgi:hypothetical protein